MIKPVRFTKSTRDEKRYWRYIWSFRVLVIAYILIVIALAVFLHSYIYIALIMVFNAIVVYTIGVTAVKSLVFPFSFWVINDVLNGQSSMRYAADFSGLLEKCYVIMRL